MPQENLNHGLDFVDPKIAEFYKSYIKGASFRIPLVEELVNQVKNFYQEKDILEIGCGSGQLAKQIIESDSKIKSYIVVEPAEEMVDQEVRDLQKFTLVVDSFLDWRADRQFDIVIAKYVIHDYPEEYARWYKKIASVLKPGGILLVLDAFLIDDPEANKEHIDYYIGLANGLEVGAEDKETKEKWVEHLEYEYEHYQSIEDHLDAMKAVGLAPEILKSVKNEYLLKATK